MIDNTIVLTSDTGEDVTFEFLDLIEYDEEEYIVLLPIDDTEGEVYILKVGEEEDSYCGVEDETVLNNVFLLFKEKFQDEFDFVD